MYTGLKFPQPSFALPEALKSLLSSYWQQLIENDQAESLLATLANDAGFQDQLVRVFCGSDYVARITIQQPELLQSLYIEKALQQSYQPEDICNQLIERLHPVADEDSLLRELRLFRTQQMVRIIWRDFNRLAPLEETTRDLSLLAEATTDLALDWLYNQACKKYGVPTSRKEAGGEPQRLVVLGMGKLGAYELNLSSDIDLIFAYPEKGETQAGEGQKTLENQTFFVRLGQKLIHALDTITAEGFVFRVDMRLRPYGNSGALALSFDALQEYYQTQGRDWERYAMIKARPIAGDIEAGRQLLNELSPFVYRRYLDFGAIKSMRDMKQMIRQEEQRRGLQGNIKLGAGGIREIEFIAQVFQLIWGGKDQRLQQTALLPVLSVLAENDYMPKQAVQGLVDAYHFLRNVEHALQALEDKQTQELPENDLARLRLAFVMGFEGLPSFEQALQQHRDFVQAEFNDLIAESEEASSAEEEKALNAWDEFWRHRLTLEKKQKLDEAELTQWLEQQGFTEAETAYQQLLQFRVGKKVQSMDQTSVQRLDQFMPHLLSAIVQAEQPDLALERILPLIDSVARRTAYLVMLLENPSAIEQLVKLCLGSPVIAEELVRYPLLLDELLDASQLYRPAGPKELYDELKQQTLRIPQEDLEQQMDCLRQFVLAHSLRVQASEISGSLPLMKVSDYLTYLAEAMLQEVLNQSWRHMVAKYGLPGGIEPGDEDIHFVVLGYGKLGGIELGHDSDLDLVFVHDTKEHAMTQGEKSIENNLFYTRLVQRIVHLLSVNTASGRLYEVDMRLRPSGAAGLLVTSLATFEKYQQDKAWTWEHQALVRARVVAGSQSLADKFLQVRQTILSQARDEQSLQSDVLAMRKKMAENLGSAASSDQFDIKQDPGGIVDIEFIVQYSVLAWSHLHPELLTYTDNIRILEALKNQSLLSADEADHLMSAYIEFRSATHRLKLQKLPAKLNLDELSAGSLGLQRERVQAVWNRLFGAK